MENKPPNINSNSNIGPIKHLLNNKNEQTIFLRKATISQKQIIANLLELYAYDFTEIWGFDIGDDGRYGYKFLDLFWNEPEYYPYLIYVDNKLAGFALIQKGLKQFSILADNNMWNMTEFFIMKKFRHKGIGSLVAHQIWDNFKGKWQIRVLKDNPQATHFWTNAIQSYTKTTPSADIITFEGDDWLIFKFESRF